MQDFPILFLAKSLILKLALKEKLTTLLGWGWRSKWEEAGNSEEPEATFLLRITSSAPVIVQMNYWRILFPYSSHSVVSEK